MLPKPDVNAKLNYPLTKTQKMDSDIAKQYLHKHQAILFSEFHNPKEQQTAFFLPGLSAVSQEIKLFRDYVDTTNVTCLAVEQNKKIVNQIPREHWDAPVICSRLDHALKESDSPISFVGADFSGSYSPSTKYHRIDDSNNTRTEKVIASFAANLASKAVLFTNHSLNFRGAGSRGEYPNLINYYNRCVINGSYDRMQKYYDFDCNFLYNYRFSISNKYGSTVFFALLKLIEQTHLKYSIKLEAYTYDSYSPNGRNIDKRECAFFYVDKTLPFNEEETSSSLIAAYGGTHLSPFRLLNLNHQKKETTC